jgi:hypothetical protein
MHKRIKQGIVVASVIGLLVVADFVAWSARQPPAMPLQWAPSDATPDLAAFERAAENVKFSDAQATAQLLALAEPLARSGDFHAQRVMGLSYIEGHNGHYRANYCEAARWLEQGARQIDLPSMLILSVMLITGQGVKQDLNLGSTLLGLVRRHPSRVDNALDQTIQWVERALAARDPRFADPAYGEKITNDYRAMNLTEMPSVIIPPSIDILLIGPTITQVLYQSSGCHDSVPNGVIDLFYVLDRDESRFKLYDFAPQE